jgi:muramidase (phage lysozyme)
MVNLLKKETKVIVQMISVKAVKGIIGAIIKKFPKNIRTKLKNINKAGICDVCPTKRVSQNSRISLPYYIIRKSGLTLDQLKTYTNGVVIEVPFREYERIRKSSVGDITSNDELDEYIINNIGGETSNPVAAIVTIRKEDGYSGSSVQREDLVRLKNEIVVRGWEPVAYNPEKTIKGKKNKGNANWSGHYYYKISGGSQQSFKSHPNKEPQIFTTHKGFMSTDKIIIDVMTSLVWQILHIFDIDKFIPREDALKYKQTLEDYLKNTTYFGKSCYESMKKLENIRDGKLISPITQKEISINAFDKETVDGANKDEIVDISHDDAVNKNNIRFCPENNVMLSDYFPGNLFWDTHLGNMQQQSFTVKEYWAEMEKRNMKRILWLMSMVEEGTPATVST